MGKVEGANRKRLGILMMCWGVIIPAILESFIFSTFLPKISHPFPFSTLLFGPAVALYVTQVYWKR